MRRGPKPAKSKGDAKPPAPRKSPKDDGARVRDLEQRLEEALKREAEAGEQQAATSEILRIISASPAVLQPVLDTLVANAARVCGALDATLHLRDGDFLPIMAHYGVLPISTDHRFLVDRSSAVGQAVLDRQIIHIHDIAAAGDLPAAQARARQTGLRTILAIPLLRGDSALGGFVLRRAEVHPFSDKQIDLLKTFADQAVIAIETVRLFRELEASNRELRTSLETQTATSDILRVISRSQTDIQPVFDTIVESALRLLKGYASTLTQLVGDQVDLGALTSTDTAGYAALRARFPQPLAFVAPHPYTIRQRVPLNMADAHSDPRFPESLHAYARVRGFRSLIVVPMLRHGEAIGTISVHRSEPGGFTDDEIALLQTFADQAVIAIENARLLSELQQRNAALAEAHAQVTEALDQQTATAEILRVISQSPTDVQPVFDTIVRSAVRLCDGLFSALFQFDGELLHEV